MLDSKNKIQNMKLTLSIYFKDSSRDIIHKKKLKIKKTKQKKKKKERKKKIRERKGDIVKHKKGSHYKICKFQNFCKSWCFRDPNSKMS